MQAIILAAGMGKRLKHLTQNNTKCMVKVNGTTLIERVLRQLDNTSIEKVVIVVGYEGKKLMDYLKTLGTKKPIVFINNPIYDKTNNIYSLALAKENLLSDDTILLESDIIFQDGILEALIDDPRKNLALVDKYEPWMDGTCLRLDEEDNIVDFISGKNFSFEDSSDCYKTVNIYKFSKEFSSSFYVPFLNAYEQALGNNEYYEQVLRVITMLDKSEIKARKLAGELWYEIDDEQDLDIASSLFASEEERLDMIQARYGGYWRYPKLIDFCYLVNPYFPPKKLISEMKASFKTLLTEYPSGMRVNSLLAAKNFGVTQDYIIAGNGAAELIKACLDNVSGKLGIVRPTFEEYPNRYQERETIAFTPNNDNFSYTIEDLKAFFADKDVSTIILINPDNPSGNYIPKTQILDFCVWCEEKNITLLLDESFVDFAEEKDSSLIADKILEAHKNLIVMKSISKSYGVPGIRLGVLASSNKELVATLKKSVSIWNINSFGEFYLQIAEKYKKNYASSLVQIKAARKSFVEALSSIKKLRVIPSQANYIMVELTGDKSSRMLTRELLSKHNIFIKDLTSKIKLGDRQFLRLAVRDEKDNAKLIEVLKQELN